MSALNVMQPGLYKIAMDEYLALDALSSGICHTLLTESPAHARYAQTHPHESNSAMDMGTIVHRVLLEGHENSIVLVEADDWKTKAAREARDQAHADGFVPILTKVMEEVRDMVAVARTYIAGSEIAGIFERGKPEQTLLWQEGGLWCKARPDWLSDDHRTLIHFKTTQRSANPEGFSAHMGNMGYDVAGAFYARGMCQIFRLVPSQVLTVFLVQETMPPYACSLIGLAPSLMDIAVVKVEHAMAVWAACSAGYCWPAYPARICYGEARPWQITQAAERALAWNDYEAYERLTEIGGAR